MSSSIPVFVKVGLDLAADLVKLASKPGVTAAEVQARIEAGREAISKLDAEREKAHKAQRDRLEAP